jgi:hypothetical protein
VTTKTEPPKRPDLAVPGELDNASANDTSTSSKPLPELPPKFKFADEIVVDKGSNTKMPAEPKKVEPAEIPSPAPDAVAVRLADEKPLVVDAPVPPSAAVNELPSPANTAPAQENAPEKPATAAEQPAAIPADPEASATSPEPARQEPPPPVKPAGPAVSEPVPDFTDVDHDMLDAALASLAVHDDAEVPTPKVAAAANQPAQPEPIPEVTLDKAIEQRRAEIRAGTGPAERDRKAAQLEEANSLEDMSDTLAETLFGNDELEALSLQIRDKVASEEDSPVALENVEGAGLAPVPTPDAPQPPATPVATTPAAPAESPAPEAPSPGTTPPVAVAPPPTAARPPVAMPPGTRAPQAPAAPSPAGLPEAVAAQPAEIKPAAVAAPPPDRRGPQPEPIENQFNSSITATLTTLNNRDKAAEDDSKENPGGLLGRLKGTFKS